MVNEKKWVSLFMKVVAVKWKGFFGEGEQVYLIDR